MSEEVFEMICAMDRRNIELQVALQCAPTIAGLKTSNLLIVCREDENAVRFVLKHTGLYSYRLVFDRKRVVFLVFNKQALEQYLRQEDVRKFLVSCGYETEVFGQILRTFQQRYDAFVKKEIAFPHEMGVLLGYPVDDVVGFINCGGKDFKYSGYWKVYSNVEVTKELFNVFDEIKDQMVLKVSRGETIKQIIDYYRCNQPSLKKAV